MEAGYGIQMFKVVHEYQYLWLRCLALILSHRRPAVCLWCSPPSVVHHKPPGHYWEHSPPALRCPSLSTTASTCPAAVDGNQSQCLNELCSFSVIFCFNPFVTNSTQTSIVGSLTWTTSPFLTVSSLWFLEMKSYVTYMSRDWTNLKYTKGI